MTTLETSDERRHTEAQLRELSETCAGISRASGFAPTSWENLPAYLMFVVTEVDEARCAVDKTAFEAEVADIAIRLLVHLYSLWEFDWHFRPLLPSGSGFWSSRDELLEVVINRVSLAAKLWRRGRSSENEVDVCICLQQALGGAVSIGECFGFSVVAAVAAKCKVNASRPHLHGNLEVIG
jgi:hypothetical protein